MRIWLDLQLARNSLDIASIEKALAKWEAGERLRPR
jgi:hypothetical protein